MEPVTIPIEDALDLHTFLPRDIPDLLEDYLTECLKAGLYSVRIIHGKGKRSEDGPRLKHMVRQVLREHSGVLAFTNSKPANGGTGAVDVLLKSV